MKVRESSVSVFVRPCSFVRSNLLCTLFHPLRIQISLPINTCCLSISLLGCLFLVCPTLFHFDDLFVNSPLLLIAIIINHHCPKSSHLPLTRSEPQNCKFLRPQDDVRHRLLNYSSFSLIIFICHTSSYFITIQNLCLKRDTEKCSSIISFLYTDLFKICASYLPKKNMYR